MPINHGQSDQSSSSGNAEGQPDRSSADPLDRLRKLRAPKERARGIGGDITLEMKAIKKISRSESAAIEAWTTAAPDQINDFTTIAGLKAGKLMVLVPSAAHRHVVDRWLKSGGMSEFQALARVPIRGIDLQIAPQTPNPAQIHPKTL